MNEQDSHTATEMVKESDLFDRALEGVIRTGHSWLPESSWAQALLALSMLIFIAGLLYYVVKHYVVRLLQVGMRRLPGWWLKSALEGRLLDRLMPLIPIFIIGRGIAFVPHIPSAFAELVQRFSQALFVFFFAQAIGTALNIVNTIYNRYPVSRGRPIKGYVQVAKLIVYIAAAILMISALMAESPWVFLTGLGAMMAVILLIFRDTLLSLVAGIQLVNNDLVRVGDWIEMPQFNADGDVIDISLNVVRVRNWDKTITAIPTHKFLEHSFKNWRGMFDEGGRRISRPIHIDMTSIRFLTREEIKRFEQFRLLQDYMARKMEELDAYNRAQEGMDDPSLQVVNARHLTNIGTFRAYILAYLKQHPLVHREFTTLVRQLEPGPQGLPLQIWTHIKDTRWIQYEDAQSDIFDHILAVIPEFGLRVFQEPTGHDFGRWRDRAP